MVLVAAAGPSRAGDAVPPEALAAAPAWVRPLQCRDVATTDGQGLTDARFREWFDGMMASVANLGLSLDEIYKQFLLNCGRDQNWSVVAAVLTERNAVAGLGKVGPDKSLLPSK
jgi:hypothetical protein